MYMEEKIEEKMDEKNNSELKMLKTLIRYIRRSLQIPPFACSGQIFKTQGYLK